MRYSLIAAVALTVAATSAGAEIVAIANSSGTLIRWNTDDLSAPVGTVTISATPGGSPLIMESMAFRPSDGMIYALLTKQLYRINADTGIATLIGTMALQNGTTAIDLDPVADEIRVIVNQQSACIDYRVDPDTAAIIGTPVLLQPNSTPQIYSTTFSRDLPPRFLAIENLTFPQWLIEIGEPTPSDLTYLTPMSLPANIPYGGFDTSFTQPNIAYFAWTMFPVPINNPHTGQLATINLTTGAYTTLMTYQAPGFFTTNLVVIGSTTPPPTCPGDANGDNSVDGADLSVLLGQFGSSITPGTGGDFNNDGVVNGADLSVLLGNFGGSC